jgi:hypothetical protein
MGAFLVSLISIMLIIHISAKISIMAMLNIMAMLIIERLLWLDDCGSSFLKLANDSNLRTPYRTP